MKKLKASLVVLSLAFLFGFGVAQPSNAAAESTETNAVVITKPQMDPGDVGS